MRVNSELWIRLELVWSIHGMVWPANGEKAAQRAYDREARMTPWNHEETSRQQSLQQGAYCTLGRQ